VFLGENVCFLTCLAAAAAAAGHAADSTAAGLGVADAAMKTGMLETAALQS